MSDDLAFAGAARQAEMVRAGEVSPTELVQLCLERIDRLDPQLNAFRKVFAEKAMLEAEQAEARLKAGDERPLLGVPIAIKDEIDVAGEINTARHRRLHRAGQGRLRDGAPPARGGRDHRRPDPAAGAGDLRLHRVGHLRRHPQPLEPAAHPGGLERRLGRGGRRRPGPDRLGRRRRRLDPHPRRLLRPLRPQALSAAGSRWRRSSKAGAAWRSMAASAATCSTRRSGSTSSPAARRSRSAPPPPERPFVESAKTTARQAARRLLDAGAARGGAADRLRRGQAGRRRRRRAARSLGHEVCPARSRLGPDRQQHHRRASSRASPRRSPKCRSPSASNGAPAASAGSAACSPRRSTSGRCAAARPISPASTRSSTPSTCWSRR